MLGSVITCRGITVTRPNSEAPQSRDRGASPIIASLLLVVIVVIIGSITGVYAYTAFADVSGPTPVVTFGVAHDRVNGNQTVTIYHQNGDPLERQKLTVKGTKSGQIALAGAKSYDPGAMVVHQ